MSLSGQRVVPFAGEMVGVEWSGERAGRATELAFGPRDDRDDRLPDVFFRLGARSDAPHLTLFRGRACLYRGGSVATAAHLLLQAVLDTLIGRSAGGLVLHAALLGRAEAGVLLPGPTGTGKTMLSAWLARRGLDPLSDEACYLAERAGEVEGFARAFCFKGRWAEPLGIDGVDRERVLQDDAVSLVPADVIRPPSQRRSIVPRLIVFPRFRAAAGFRLTRLTPARAAVRLIETVANARNLTDHGVARVTELARAVAAYELAYGGFEQLDPFLELIEALP